MALPEPPPNVPRIFEVQNPESGHYVVLVRMPTQLAAKYPDKPWGTRIEDVGLSQKDADLYPGYTLVAVETMKGSPDLLWVFQKLDGPQWTTQSSGGGDLVPAKFRRQVRRVVVQQEVPPGSELDELDGDVVGSELEEKPNTGIATKTTVSSLIDLNAAPLIGEEMNRHGTKSLVTELLVPDGEDLPPFTYTMEKVSDNPLGDGRSVRTIEQLADPAYPVLTGYAANNDLNISVPYTTQIVDAGSVVPPTDALTEYQPIDALRSLKKVATVPSNIDTEMISYPVPVKNLDLPRVLKKVDVVWNESSSQGEMDVNWSGRSQGSSVNLSTNLDDTSSSSAACSPEIIPEIEEVSEAGLYATAHIFYLPMPVTESAVLSRLGALKWPVFKPASHVLVGFGQSVEVRAGAGVTTSVSRNDSSSTEASGNNRNRSISHGHTNVTVKLPPTLHGPITIVNSLKTMPAAAYAHIAVYGVNMPSAAATQRVTGEAKGQITPSFLPPTSPTDIPRSGHYLTDLRVKPYEFGYAQVYAEVFDAAQLSDNYNPSTPTPPGGPAIL